MYRYLYMSYITLKEAAKATGLNEMTIRRLCKKAESKPYVRLKDGKNGSLYTIQTNYLFDKYPPKSVVAASHESSIDTAPKVEPSHNTIQEYTSVLTVKDELIQVLKEEIAYLREENKGLREENKELKLLPAPKNMNEEPTNIRKSLWQRILGK